MITELAKGIYWVGVVDWDLRHFHGHELNTPRGSSYNAYLITDEKNVLVDTVWQPHHEALIRNIREIIDPARIDTVVANHAEIDHAGALPAVMRHCPKATVVVSKRGMDSFPGHYHQPWNFRAVQTGDKISIGSRELTFIETPMMHWPDSMFTYISPDAVLVSTDAFGQHFASSSRFNDEVAQEELYHEALKYYANILTPFSSIIERKVQEVLALNLPLKMICPAHGIIWRKDAAQIVTKYREWAAQKPAPAAVILYETMWNGTKMMADTIADGLGDERVGYTTYHVGKSDRNEIIARIFESRAVVVGSPTLNQGVLPNIMPLLDDLRGLKFLNKIGAAFGCYGWSGESVKVIEEHLERAKIPRIAPGIAAKWQPGDEDLARCREFGRTIGRAVKTS